MELGTSSGLARRPLADETRARSSVTMPARIAQLSRRVCTSAATNRSSSWIRAHFPTRPCLRTRHGVRSEQAHRAGAPGVVGAASAQGAVHARRRRCARRGTRVADRGLRARADGPGAHAHDRAPRVGRVDRLVRPQRRDDGLARRADGGADVEAARAPSRPVVRVGRADRGEREPLRARGAAGRGRADGRRRPVRALHRRAGVRWPAARLPARLGADASATVQQRAWGRQADAARLVAQLQRPAVDAQRPPARVPLARRVGPADARHPAHGSPGSEGVPRAGD